MKIVKLFVCILPLLLGFGVIHLATLYSRFTSTSLSSGLIDAVAVMFALFASLLFSELWVKNSRINELMMKQATSLRALLRMTEPLGDGSERINAAVKSYIQKIKQEETDDIKLGDSRERVYQKDSFSSRTVKELYFLAADTALFRNNIALQTAFYAKLEDLRESWFERKELRKSQILPAKIFLLFIFGFFTQLAIAISQVDSYKAMRDSELIFSCAFTAAVSILLVTANTKLHSHFVKIEILDDVA